MMKFLSTLLLVGTTVSGETPKWLSDLPKGRLLRRTSARCSKEGLVTERGICLKSALDNELYIYVRVEQPVMGQTIGRLSLPDDETEQVRFREPPRVQSDEPEHAWPTNCHPEACPDGRCRLIAPKHTHDDLFGQGTPRDGRIPRPLKPASIVQAQATRQVQPKTNRCLKGLFAMKEAASRLLCHSSRTHCQTRACGKPAHAREQSRGIQHTEGRCECVQSQPRQGFPGCNKFIETITCRKRTRAT